MTLSLFPNFKPAARIAFPDDLVEAQADARRAAEMIARQAEDAAKADASEKYEMLYGDADDPDAE